jgi:DNA-binding NtrC family response regulator
MKTTGDGRRAVPKDPDGFEEDIALAAAIDLPVLIVAASAECRRLCAHGIHAGGHRATAPFITSRVAEPTADLTGGTRDVEHAKGDGPGRLREQFERARGGTLFIDDIASLGPRLRNELQALLEEDIGCGDGAGPARRWDVRVIAGASRTLTPEEASDPAFAPLFYRLNVVTIVPRDDRT